MSMSKSVRMLGLDLQCRSGQLHHRVLAVCNERAPRRHAIAERNSEKLILHLSQKRVWLNGSSRLSAVMEARRRYTTVAISPIPPEVENTSREKDPRPTSLTLSSYALFFSFSFFL